MASWSARADEFRGLFPGRVTAGGWAEGAGGALLAEGLGECVTQLAVVLLEAADAFGGGFQPAKQ
jgi:hypothetical protein